MEMGFQAEVADQKESNQTITEMAFQTVEEDLKEPILIIIMVCHNVIMEADLSE
jgi:aromatic ring-opening dioxygenase LigB subunit